MKRTCLSIICLIVILTPALTLAATINVPSDQTTIQSGIDASVNGDLVLLANGTYTGTGNYNVDFNGKSVTVKSSGGSGNCIVDCEQNGRGFLAYNQETVTLEGLTVKNADAGDNEGGGVYAKGSVIMIIDCIFDSNSSDQGGAVSSSSSSFINCTFISNSASWYGGAVSSSYSSFADCTFTGNRASRHGGAVSSLSSFFTGCTFDSNIASWCGGAVSSSSSYFTGCTFTSNSASSYGGAVLSSTASSFINCTLTSNSAFYGGAVYSTPADNSSPYGSSPPASASFTNCTLTLNEATRQGGAIWCNIPDAPENPITLNNCIIWGNTAVEGPEIYEAEKPIIITYSNIQGGHTGIGNINEDPLFINPDNDLHLQKTSPCIDTGTADGAPSDDLDGNYRPTGSGYDIGAYEFQNTITNIPPTITSFSSTTIDCQTYENITFSCIANDPDGGNIVSYEWDFNNDSEIDSTTSGSTVDHNYSTAGNYSAKCTVEDDEGQTTTSEILNINVTDVQYNKGQYNYYLPYFCSNTCIWTGLGLANKSQNISSEIQLTAYDSNGNILSKEQKNITAYGQNAFHAASHITGEGWILVNSHQPLSGLAFLGNGTLMANIPVNSELFTSLIIPHIAQSETWDTNIMICNPNNEEADIIIKYIDQQGIEKGTQTFSILSNGSGVYPLASIFTGISSMAGRIEINSSSEITAFALYNNIKSTGSYFAGINAESNSSN